jgi:group I intron endonuclease
MVEKICGIYCIENIINKHKYTGKSVDIYRRWNTHKTDLKNNKDNCSVLQNVYNKYGSENFKYYIILRLPRIEWLLNLFEIFFIFILKSHFSMGGYNLSWGGRTSRTGILQSDETKQKMKNSWTKERREKQGLERSGKNNVNFGKKMSEKVKEKISNSVKNKTENERTLWIKRLSESHLGQNPWNLGISPSQETRDKISKNRRGVFVGKPCGNYSSAFIGVTYKKDRIKWKSYCSENGKQKHIGYFGTEIEAAKAYDEYIVEHNLPNSLNFPENYEVK